MALAVLAVVRRVVSGMIEGCILSAWGLVIFLSFAVVEY